MANQIVLHPQKFKYKDITGQVPTTGNPEEKKYSFIIKFKKMKLTKPQTFKFMLRKAILPVIAGIFLFTSCKPDCSKCPSSGKSEQFISDTLKYPCFTLGRTKIEASKELMGTPPIPFHKVVILKIKFSNVASDIFEHELLAYPAKDHMHHGVISNTTPPPINLDQLASCYTRLPRRLILGNIYVDWKTIKDSISLANGDLKPEFNYLKFTPVDKTSGITLWDGHLRYSVSAHKADGTKMWPLKGGGADDSKPSPPAPPL